MVAGVGIEPDLKKVMSLPECTSFTSPHKTVVPREVIETPNLSLIKRLLCHLSYLGMEHSARIELAHQPYQNCAPPSTLRVHKTYGAQPGSRTPLSGLQNQRIAVNACQANSAAREPGVIGHVTTLWARLILLIPRRSGADGGTRNLNLRFTIPPLYHLSHIGKTLVENYSGPCGFPFIPHNLWSVLSDSN